MKATSRSRWASAAVVLGALAWLLWPDREESAPVPEVPVTGNVQTLHPRVSEALSPEHPREPASTVEREGPGDSGGSDASQPFDAERLHEFLRMNAKRTEAYVDRFCAESSRLRAVGPVRHAGRRTDAAVYLSVRIDWENGQLGLLDLPEGLLQRMRTPEGNWRRFTAADYAGLDFSWFQDLAAFDHWSLGADGPLKNAQTIDFYAAPQPDFRLLQQWVMLRLVKARNEGDLPHASVEVRHLADLCASTETLNGEFQRIAMLRTERAVWALAGLQPVEPLPSPEDVEAYGASIVVGAYFLLPGVSASVRERALECAPSRCVMLAEAIGATSAMVDLEPEATQALAWARQQGGCDSSWLKRVVGKTHPAIVNEMLANPTSDVERSMSRVLEHGKPLP